MRRHLFAVLSLVGLATSAGISDNSATAANKEPHFSVKVPHAAPELRGLGEWINSDPLTLASLKGHVVVVDFWTFQCINCRRTLPSVKSWYEAYHDKGLEIIGVHTPELAAERVPANVRNAVKHEGIRYPVVLDPKFRTWNAYNNVYWPAWYVIDKRGMIRHVHEGEGDYANTARVIEALLAE
jgi:thiol-disulfide isomerase/thioredoxin